MSVFKAARRPIKYFLLAIALVIATSTVAVVAWAVSQPTNRAIVSSPHVLSASDVDTKQLFHLTNDDRAKAGVGVLTEDPRLDQSAAARCSDMAAKHYYSHISPDGTQWYASVKTAEPNYVIAAENIAAYFSDASAMRVNDDWLASVGHRANIENKAFTHVGFATCLGIYQGRSTVFSVEHFVELAPNTNNAVSVAFPAQTSDVNCNLKHQSESDAYFQEYVADSNAYMAYSADHTPMNDLSWLQDDTWYKSYLNADLKGKATQHDINLTFAGCPSSFTLRTVL